MLKKMMFIDTETTGVDFTKHGIWQMAGKIRIDGVDVERFNWKMQPFPGQAVSDEALKVNDPTMTIERLREFPTPQEIFKKFTEMCSRYVNKFDRKDKMWFTGYNAQFDSQFVRQWMINNGDKYYGSWFWFPYIDVMQLAGFALAPKRHELENFKLGTVMDYMGFKFENAHDAMADIDATANLFDHFYERGLRPEAIPA
jgi:DNA polymerase III subunit epsilon